MYSFSNNKEYKYDFTEPKFKKAFDFLKRTDLADLEPQWIELMNEGYDEPIKEVLEWFENYQIPASLADEVEEIYMDGGNDIYLQIMPNWDGEDDFYDVNQLSLEEVSQFKNLKNMTLMSSKLDDIKENLKELDINIELL